MKRISYQEGTWFGVPLRHGGFGIGVVARKAPKGGTILAYLFGPKRIAVPTLADVVPLTAADAVKCLRMGDLGLIYRRA
jgi:hypothetical protein